MVQAVFDAPPEVVYPESDGRPVGETDAHIDLLLETRYMLREHFREHQDVYVAGNLFLYYERGNPRAVVAPDIFVVLGAPRGNRRTYRLWEEPKGPDFVLEFTSRSTRREDHGPKREVYRSLGVGEYFQFDPLEEYLRPALLGLRLVDGDYEPMSAWELPGGGLAHRSEALGLDLRLEDGTLRFRDPATGRYLLNPMEEAAARRESDARLKRLEVVRQELEVRVEELEARFHSSQGSEPDAGS